MNTNDRSIVGLTMLAHGMVHTYELSIPIFMTIWLGEFGVSKAVLGVVVGIGYGLFGLGALPGGILSDRFGSRKLIAFCLAGMGGAFALLSIAPNIYVVTLALAAWGAAASVYHPAGLALISKGVRQRGHALALHGMAGNMGIAFGPLATALLLLVVDWRWVAAILAAPAALATAYTLAASFNEAAAEPPDAASEANAPAARGPWRKKLVQDSRLLFASGFAVVFVIVLLSGLYYRGTLTFLPDLLTQYVTFSFSDAIQLDAGSFVYAGLLMVGMLGQYVGGKLTDRMATERAMAGAFGVLTLIAVLFPFMSAWSTASLLVISTLLGFFLFVVQPLYQATVAEYTPASMRGLSYGFTYLGVFGIGALGAALAGALLDFYSPTVMFAVLAVFAALAAGLSLYLLRRHTQPEEAAAAS